MRTAWAISALLLLFTTAAYWQVRSFDFTSYDDTFFVTDNADVLSGLTRQSVAWAFTSMEAFWHPLTWLSHMLDVELYGTWAGGHHLTNLFWHLAGVVLLLWAWYRLTGEVWPSALVAALFALHPLHAESVSWVSERKGVLSSFFWIATLWSYASYAKRPGVGRYLLVTLALGLGLMSKPTLVTLPCVLLLLDYWPLGRFRPFDKKLNSAWQTPCDQRGWHWLLLEKIPWFVLVGVASGIAVLAEGEAGALNWLPDVTFTSRVYNALVVYVLYLAKFFWPAGLMFFYPHPGNEIPVWAALGSGGLLLTVLVLAIWQARRRPYLLVGWLWYLGTLVPVIGLVQVGGHRMADRYTDLPLIGISVMLGWGLAEICSKVEGAAASVISGGVVALVLLGGMSWYQAATWRDSVSLYQHAIKIDPNNWLPLSNLGALLEQNGQFDDAYQMHLRAIEANPDNPDAVNNLASSLMRQGRYPEAIEHLSVLLKSQPDYPLAHTNLAIALAALGQTAEAREHHELAIRLAPNMPALRRNFGRFLAAQQQWDEAIEQFRLYNQLAPMSPDSHYQLAAALLQDGRLSDAEQAFTTLIERWPELAEGYAGRAEARAESGKSAEAIVDFRRALELNERVPGAAIRLAWILATSPEPDIRDGAAAMRWAESACAASEFQDPQALDALAAACAESNRFDRARDLAERAQKRAEERGDGELAKAIQTRREMYQRDEPYREPASVKSN